MLLPLPRWFAHRGGGSLAPENTLAGIRLAARLGFRAVEFDVMLSADGTPLLLHDETLERTSNGVGRVSETPDVLLFSLDAGGGEPIPRFFEAALLCRQLGLLANIEIKPAPGHEIRTAETVARMVADVWHDARQKPLLSSFSLAALEVARDLLPDVPRGILFDRVPIDWRREFDRLQAQTLHCNAEHLADDILQEAGATGIPVLCYTVNVVEKAKMLFGRGVTSLFTDRLDLFAAETNDYKGLHLGG